MNLIWVVANAWGGSLLQELMLSNHYDGTLAERLHDMRSDIFAMADEIGCEHKLSNLTLPMFYKANSWPILSAKGAEVADLLRVLHVMCGSMQIEGSEHDAIRLSMMDAVVRMMDIVKNSPDFLFFASITLPNEPIHQ